MAATLARHALLVYAPAPRPKMTVVPLIDRRTTWGEDDDQPFRDSRISTLLRVDYRRYAMERPVTSMTGRRVGSVLGAVRVTAL
jgi:hypothetical protein